MTVTAFQHCMPLFFDISWLRPIAQAVLNVCRSVLIASSRGKKHRDPFIYFLSISFLGYCGELSPSSDNRCCSWRAILCSKSFKKLEKCKILMEDLVHPWIYPDESQWLEHNSFTHVFNSRASRLFWSIYDFFKFSKWSLPSRENPRDCSICTFSWRFYKNKKGKKLWENVGFWILLN